MDFNSTVKGSLLENFYPEGWDFARIDACCSHPPEAVCDRQPFWHENFRPELCADVAEFDVKMGHAIAAEIRHRQGKGAETCVHSACRAHGHVQVGGVFPERVEYRLPARLVLQYGRMGGRRRKHAYGRGVVRERHAGRVLRSAGRLTVPEGQRNFATKDNLPSYPEKIAALKREGARLVLVYGIGRMCHNAFWEPHFGSEFATDEAWRTATFRLGAKLHPLTVEQNAITSFRSRTSLVPCRANTIGPGLMLQADYAIGGADGALSRGMQWQGMSLWMTLRYGPTRFVPSSYVPTLPGRLFFLRELAGPLVPDVN